MAGAATVFDVARLAGVSRGTVDRVVYGRGHVSETTKAKVEAAIRELDYSANPSASSLAMKKVRKIAYLTPSYRPGEYWDLIDRGFEMGKAALDHFNIRLLPFHYDVEDPGSYVEKSAELLACAPDGVITHQAPREDFLQFADSLKSRNIPLAFIDNKYDDVDYSMYYGIDAYKSGRLGAFLLTHRREVDSIVVIRIHYSDHTQDPNATRRQGVMDYIAEHYPGIPIYTIFINGVQDDNNGRIISEFFSAHPDVRHIICPNSRLFLISDWLRDNPSGDRVVVGYDDLDGNLKALKDGTVEFLVTRKVPEQSRLLLEDFAQCVLYGRLPAKKNNYVHMDILHQMNLDDYR